MIYGRVSTEKQAAEGVSAGDQRARAEAWAASRSLPVVGAFEDVLSGKRADNRPGLRAALDLACSTKSALVVYSLSRLARSIRDALAISERLDKAGADLVSLTESIDTTNAFGKFTFRLLAILAELERDITSDRTRSALAHKRAKGERTGNVPFGSDLAPDGVALLDNPAERAALAVIRGLSAAGLSARAIAAELRLRSVPTKTGKAHWHHSTVGRLLRRGPAAPTAKLEP